MVEINWNPDSRTLRLFARLQAVFFCVVAGLWRESLGIGGVVAIISASSIAGLIGLARPAWIRPVYIAWMVAVFPIGWVGSRGKVN